MTPVLFQQAPAGTRKTGVIGTYVAEFLPRLHFAESELITSTTNIAVINSTNAILKNIPTLQEDELCFLAVDAM